MCVKKCIQVYQFGRYRRPQRLVFGIFFLERVAYHYNFLQPWYQLIATLTQSLNVSAKLLNVSAKLLKLRSRSVRAAPFPSCPLCALLILLRQLFAPLATNTGPGLCLPCRSR